MSSENRFDQLFSASMLGGPYEHFRQVPPMGNKFITCGNAPYVGFYNAVDVSYPRWEPRNKFLMVKNFEKGMSGAVLTDVAKAVAGKVTNVLMNAAK